MTTPKGPPGARKARESIKSTPRPRNRKAQIVAAARELFAARGYPTVSAEEIATQVGITAGALYRHFEGKQDLLVHGLIDALDSAAENVRRGAIVGVADLIDALAPVAVSNRELGMLWGREVRYLDPEHQAVVRAHFFRTFGLVSDRLAGLRPDVAAPEIDLLAWSVMATLTSVAYHREALTSAVSARLRTVSIAACQADLVSPTERGLHQPAGILPSGRREAIVNAAADLFQRHGFRGTSMTNIGESIGLTGAAIYRHFPAKTDVLAAIVSRAIGALQVDLSTALRAADNAQEALDGALDVYIAFAMRNPRLIDILLWETGNLTEDDSRSARRAQREYLAEWESLLQRCQPSVPNDEARLIITAVLSVINDAVRTASLRTSPSLTDNLRSIGRAMLAVEHDAQRSWNASKA